MVVDDNDDNRDILVRMMHDAGIGVLQATCAKEATTLLANHRIDELPDLIFLDITHTNIDN
jgi:CheY-like chemotaxis protein